MEASPQPKTPEATYEDALGDGRLVFQRCDECGNAWLPPRGACPSCLAEHWSWNEAGGSARLVSWVVYHRAYDDDLADRLPYAVLLIELAEGPRMISALADPGQVTELEIEAELGLVVNGERRLVLARKKEGRSPS